MTNNTDNVSLLLRARLRCSDELSVSSSGAPVKSRVGNPRARVFGALPTLALAGAHWCPCLFLEWRFDSIRFDSDTKDAAHATQAGRGKSIQLGFAP